MARRGRRLPLALLVCAALLGAAPAARADGDDPQQSGHPLRIAAYVLHPIGVILDTVFLRPAHWLVHREPWTTLFGHTD